MFDPQGDNRHVRIDRDLIAGGFGLFPDFPAGKFLVFDRGSLGERYLLSDFHRFRFGRGSFQIAKRIRHGAGLRPIRDERHIRGDSVFRKIPERVAVFPTVKYIPAADRVLGHFEQFVFRRFHGISFARTAVDVKRDFRFLVTRNERERQGANHKHCN